MRGHALQLARFAAVSLFCFALGLAVLTSLHELAGVHYLVAYVASFVVTSTLGFLLNGWYTFRTQGRGGSGLVRYMTVNVGLLVLNGAMLRLLVEQFHVWYVTATVVLAMINTPVSFLAHRVVSYRLGLRPASPAHGIGYGRANAPVRDHTVRNLTRPQRMTQMPSAPEDNLRVMFDPQIFCHQRFGGVSRYFCSTVLEMQRMGGITPLIAAPFHFNEYLDRLPPSLVRGTRVRWFEGKTAIAYGLSVLPAKVAARRFKPDILHNTYYFPVTPPAGARGILTIYDMIHEKFPKYFGNNSLTARLKAASVARADHIICISESTRRDVLDAYDIAEERVSVTHLGFDPLNSLVTDETPADFRTRVLGSNTPYLLYVGSRATYKNFQGLLDAYASSAWLRANFFLLCFGGGRFTAAERLALSKAGIEERVRYLGGSDAALAACYSHAALFVCPSLYEGFGIPVLEAMSLDCPVACSNSSSLPEVAGEAARLFDPGDQDSIRTALEDVLNSPTAATALKERGRIRRTRFSWRNCAANTVSIYRHVCAERAPMRHRA